MSYENRIGMLRNPEARTEYADRIIDSMRGYLTEVFDQKDPKGQKPEDILKLKNGDALYVPYGSVLHGTADLDHRSDLDLTAFYFQDFSSEAQRLGLLTKRSMTRMLHPRTIDMERHIIIDVARYPYGRYSRSSTRHLYRQFHGTRFHNKVYPDELFALHAQTKNTASLAYVIAHGGPFSYQSYTDVLPLLTATPSMVFEASAHALRRHQTRIVQALTIRNNQQDVDFQKDWEYLEKTFAGMNDRIHQKHRCLDQALLSSYIYRSDRFQPEKREHAADLLRGVRKGQQLPSLKDFQVAFGVPADYSHPEEVVDVNTI